MDFLQSLYDNIIFRLSIRTWMEWLDLLLVILTFYAALNWARRRQAAFLLRGALLVAVILFVVTIVLPFPTFDWLIRGVLVAMLIAAPVIFHPELRRLLERLGRIVGLAWGVQHTIAENVTTELIKTVDALSIKKTGALIVLEGNSSLADIIETGVPIGGRMTHDLLQTIFYGENPLHDGAVIIREDRILAASCVLPLTQRSLAYTERRFGTRHRAAVGLSERSDALVVVVSEETGKISVARQGRLYRHISSSHLREKLVDFHMPSRRRQTQQFSWRQMLSRLGKNLRHRPNVPNQQQLLTQVVMIFVASLFALTFWTFVIEQTNPPRREVVENISLRVEDESAGLILLEPLPETVSAVVQTTDQAFPSLRPGSFQAVVSLEGIAPGIQRLPIQVTPSIPEVRILSIDPPAVDVELARVISQTHPVEVDLENQQNMSPAYRVVDVSKASPAEVQVTGPEPLVQRVSQVRAAISVANITDSLQGELRPVEAVDEAGRSIEGVTFQPSQVRVSVSIERRLNAIDVGIRAVTENTPPPGYWLSDLQVTPSSVTLQGDPDQLTTIDGFIDTLPVDLSGAVGDLTMETPLILAPTLQAIDGEGNSVRTVTVVARVIPRIGDLAISQKSVELLNVPRGTRVTANAAQVDLLLSGPQPTLNEIVRNPNLVRVVIDVADLSGGQNIEVTPDVIGPSDIEYQIVPPTVLVSFPES